MCLIRFHVDKHVLGREGRDLFGGWGCGVSYKARETLLLQAHGLAFWGYFNFTLTSSLKIPQSPCLTFPNPFPSFDLPLSPVFTTLFVPATSLSLPPKPQGFSEKMPAEKLTGLASVGHVE